MDNEYLSIVADDAYGIWTINRVQILAHGPLKVALVLIYYTMG
jgi:hypothetical protein